MMPTLDSADLINRLDWCIKEVERVQNSVHAIAQNMRTVADEPGLSWAATCYLRRIAEELDKVVGRLA